LCTSRPRAAGGAAGRASPSEGRRHIRPCQKWN
jgi:hypothetical protein